MEKVVVDTHCWISFFYRNRFEKITQAFIDRDIYIFTCYEQLAELKDVHSKHKRIAQMMPLDIKIYTDAISAIAIQFEPQKRYALLADYKDNYLVDLAHQSKSTLVTNDKVFSLPRKMKTPRISIITLQQFYLHIGL
jgi:putative PIN family toxin of toxin-antitoxin system